MKKKLRRAPSPFLHLLFSILITILLSLSFVRVAAQTVFIPDYVFANWLYNHGYSSCMTGVQTMDTTCAALLTATSINCSTYNIQDLTGIQYFKNLQTLSAWGCHLAYVPSFPRTIKHLDLYLNQLTSLPALPDSLISLSADENSLVSLPTLPPTLVTLAVGHNQLTSLPALPAGMTLIWVNNNPALTCLPPVINFAGTTSGNSIMIDSTLITCMPNPIPHANYWLPFDTIPICNLFNAYGCASIWNIEGRSYLDVDQNCSTTVNEPILEGIKMLLYDNGMNLIQQVYTSEEGIYSFDQNLGTYHVQVDTANLPFDILCPASNNFTSTLTLTDSTDYGVDFRLTCKPGFDIGVRSIEAGWWRPAHDVAVHIRAGDLAGLYGVHCATNLGGSVSVTFSGPVTYVGPDAGALTPTSVTGNTLTYSVSDFGSLDPSMAFNIIMHTDSLAIFGTPVCFTMSVLPLTGDVNAGNNNLTQCFTVRTSFDPNNKEVYPAGALNPTTNPNLVYTIHFQNTGSAIAEHIYIDDTLDSNLDWSTFQLLAYSHQPFVQILDGGIMRFNFPNIQLPDSNSNEPASHGYVQYRIKAKNNLPTGTQLLNTAHIYFDFNTPVATNTTVNTITSSTGLTPPISSDHLFVVYPNPTKDGFTIYSNSFPSGDEILTVFDTYGRELLTKKLYEQESVIKTANWTSGIYILRLDTGQGSLIKKLLKE